MPYGSTSELPKNVRGVLPAKAQRIWMHVFNSAQEKGASEESAIKQAWGAVKKSYEKNDDGKWVKKMNDDVQYVPFADRGNGWFLYFPLGTVYHRGRKVDFNASDAEEMVNNFKINDVPGYDLPVNILHQDKHGVYGYIDNLRFNGKEVQWRPKFRDSKKEDVQDLGYKYFSPEIWFKGYQARDGNKYNNVAMGGALTPRPRLGRQASIAVFSDEDGWEYVDEEGNKVEPETKTYELRRIYDTMRMLKRLERVRGVENSAKEALDAMKKIAHRIVDAFGDDDIVAFEQDYKTEDGQKFSRDAYLIVPESKKPSTWKVRVESSPGKITVKQLGAAAAALNSYRSSETYRGKSLKGVTPEQVAKAKKKLVRLYKQEGVEKEEIPEYLFDENRSNEMSEEEKNLLEQILAKVNEHGEVEKIDFSEELASLKEELRQEMSVEFSEKLEEKETELAGLQEAKKEAERQAQELSEKIAEEEKVRRLAEFTDKAEELDIPVEADKFGEILMHFHDADDTEEKERYNQLMAVLESAKYAEELFEEMGSGGDVGDPVAKFEALIQERVENGETLPEATENVARERPDLYAQYDEATVKVAEGDK